MPNESSTSACLFKVAAEFRWAMGPSRGGQMRKPSVLFEKAPLVKSSGTSSLAREARTTSNATLACCHVPSGTEASALVTPAAAPTPIANMPRAIAPTRPITTRYGSACPQSAPRLMGRLPNRDDRWQRGYAKVTCLTGRLKVRVPSPVEAILERLHRRALGVPCSRVRPRGGPTLDTTPSNACATNRRK